MVFHIIATSILIQKKKSSEEILAATLIEQSLRHFTASVVVEIP